MKKPKQAKKCEHPNVLIKSVNYGHGTHSNGEVSMPDGYTSGQLTFNCKDCCVEVAANFI